MLLYVLLSFGHTLPSTKIPSCYEIFFDRPYIYIYIHKSVEYTDQTDKSSWRAFDFAQVQMNNSSSLVVSLIYEPWRDLTCHVVRLCYIPQRKPKTNKKNNKDII